jgi:GNAT superfamily N-acetyltransferase
MSFSIVPLTYADASSSRRIFLESFEQDRQTQLKQLGDISYLRDDPLGAQRGFIRDLQRASHVGAKAVDAQGAFLGSLGIEFLGFAPADVPHWDAEALGPLPELPSEEEAPPPPAVDRATATPERLRVIEMVDRLEAMENADWAKWRPVYTPAAGARGAILTGLTVDPAHQGRGVGTALLGWAAGLADRAGIDVWVHSSEAGFRAYSKAGFEVMGKLEVDLDEWAPSPPPEGGLWGHYLIRWMKRTPKGEGRATGES